MIGRIPMADGAAFKRTGIALLAVLCLVFSATAVIRDGGVDPENLGKGEWIYSVMDATNRMGGHVSSITNLSSMMTWYKSQGVRYLMVKAATSDQLYNGCLSSPQLNTALVNAAHAEGIFIFGYNRSYGANIPAEIAISDFVFQQGADGFVWDAEAEWEAGHSWITNGPAQAWALCSAVRSNWPTKFLAHAPFPIISLHSSFPYKEFGYWCDAVMPQIYHFSSAGIRRSPSAAVNWSDVNWHKFHNDLRNMPPSNIGGTTVYWTNAIKPIAPVHDVYGATGTLRCNGAATPHLDKDVMEFIDYLSADRHAPTAGGYNGVNFWRTDLHSPAQWAYIKAGTSGQFPGVVNNVVMDDGAAGGSGGWTAVRTFAATPTASTYYGATGSDTNSFGTNYLVKSRGTGSAFVEFAPQISTPGDYNVYQWHPYRADASTNVPFVVTHATGTTTVYANQKTNHGFWSFVGKFNFASGTSGRIRVTDGFSEADAVAMVDGVKLVFDAPGSVPLPPTGLAASTLSSSQIRLTWTDVASNESAYVITRAPSSGGPFSIVGSTVANATAFTNSGLAPGVTYYYRIRATNSLGASSDSTLATATTFQPPLITSQPSNRTVVTGANPAFGVSATGTAPLRYQWRFNGADIGDATNSIYVRSNAQPGHAGSYSVAVMNGGGTNVSSNVVLTVLVPPSIVFQPESRTVRVQSNVTFSVTASGSAPLSYQWRFNGANIAGANNSVLTIASASTNDSGAYSVQVTNQAGSVTSGEATLTVQEPVPARIVSVSRSTNTTLMLTASGEQGSYAVEASTNLAAWSPEATVTNTNGTFYFATDAATNGPRRFFRMRLLQ